MLLRKANFKIFVVIILVGFEFSMKFGCQAQLDCKINSLDPCNPASSCTTAGLGCLINDPLDCHNYFACINNASDVVIPSDNPVSCPFGRYFNIDNQECEIEIKPCTLPCINYNCIYSCEDITEMPVIADPNVCNNFYFCGIENAFSCGEDAPYFNGSVCTNNRYECCSACIPYCKNELTETLDPFDCKSYYLCDEIGVPDEKAHFHCPVGQNFNSTIGRCETTDIECQSLCSRPSTTTVSVDSTLFTTSSQLLTTIRTRPSESTIYSTSEKETSTDFIISTSEQISTNIIIQTSQAESTSYRTTTKSMFTTTDPGPGPDEIHSKDLNV